MLDGRMDVDVAVIGILIVVLLMLVPLIYPGNNNLLTPCYVIGVSTMHGIFMLFKLSADKTGSEYEAALPDAVQANHFGVMQVHNLRDTMVKKGQEFDRECLILEVCQPQQAKNLLEQNMGVSNALTCRISIYEERDKTILATLKPTTLLAMFNTPQLEGVAQEVEDTIVRIMTTAAQETN